jgi:hypothetical protein
MKKIVHFGILTLTLNGLIGCASLAERRANASAGLVGCLPGEIQIADGSDYAWSATCNGKKFICSAVQSGGGGTTGVAPNETVSCKERLK